MPTDSLSAIAARHARLALDTDGCLHPLAVARLAAQLREALERLTPEDRERRAALIELERAALIRHARSPRGSTIELWKTDI